MKSINLYKFSINNRLPGKSSIFSSQGLYIRNRFCYHKYTANNTFKSQGYMPTNAEGIEILARKLERARILNDLKECKTLEEYQAFVKKYEALYNDDIGYSTNCQSAKHL